MHWERYLVASHYLGKRLWFWMWFLMEPGECSVLHNKLGILKQLWYTGALGYSLENVDIEGYMCMYMYTVVFLQPHSRYQGLASVLTTIMINYWPDSQRDHWFPYMEEGIYRPRLSSTTQAGQWTAPQPGCSVQRCTDEICPGRRGWEQVRGKEREETGQMFHRQWPGQMVDHRMVLISWWCRSEVRHLSCTWIKDDSWNKVRLERSIHVHTDLLYNVRENADSAHLHAPPTCYFKLTLCVPN